MENTKTIVLELRLTRNKVLGLLALFFLAWHPAFIESETLTLTTYYPAPYGGYASILTTGQTLLARDSGNVGIGIGVPGSKLHVAGATTLSGSLYVGGPLAIVNGTQSMGRVLTSDGAGNANWADGGGPLQCVWQNYWNSGPPTACAGGGTQVVMAAKDAGGQLFPLGPPTVLPQSGLMFCCKIKP